MVFDAAAYFGFPSKRIIKPSTLPSQSSSAITKKTEMQYLQEALPDYTITQDGDVYLAKAKPVQYLQKRDTREKMVRRGQSMIYSEYIPHEMRISKTGVILSETNRSTYQIENSKKQDEWGVYEKEITDYEKQTKYVYDTRNMKSGRETIRLTQRVENGNVWEKRIIDQNTKEYDRSKEQNALFQSFVNQGMNYAQARNLSRQTETQREAYFKQQARQRTAAFSLQARAENIQRNTARNVNASMQLDANIYAGRLIEKQYKVRQTIENQRQVALLRGAPLSETGRSELQAKVDSQSITGTDYVFSKLTGYPILRNKSLQNVSSELKIVNPEPQPPAKFTDKVKQKYKMASEKMGQANVYVSNLPVMRDIKQNWSAQLQAEYEQASKGAGPMTILDAAVFNKPLVARIGGGTYKFAGGRTARQVITFNNQGPMWAMGFKKGMQVQLTEKPVTTAIYFGAGAAGGAIFQGAGYYVPNFMYLTKGVFVGGYAISLYGRGKAALTEGGAYGSGMFFGGEAARSASFIAGASVGQKAVESRWPTETSIVETKVKQYMPRYERVVIPQEGKNGIPTETEVFKGIVTYKGRPIIGYGRGKPYVYGSAMPTLRGISLDYALKQGYTPEGALAGRMAVKEIETRYPEYKPVVETGIKARRSTFGARSDIKSKPDLDQFKTLKPESAKLVLEWAKVKKAKVYGSATMQSQLPKGQLAYGRGLKSGEKTFGDIDVQISMNQPQTENEAQLLLAKLKLTEGAGNVRIQKATPMLIETKRMGQWHHAVDIHSIDMPLDKDIPLEGSWGFTYSEPSVKINGNRFMSLSESTTRKMGSSLTLRETEIAPEAHRMKDIADWVTSQRYLLQKTGNTRLFNKFESDVTSFYSEKGLYANQGSVPIADFSSSSSSRSPFMLVGISPSVTSRSASASASLPSFSPSNSPSASRSVSVSASISTSISASTSVSVSPSLSPSLSPSMSPSLSPSLSPSIPDSPPPATGFWDFGDTKAKKKTTRPILRRRKYKYTPEVSTISFGATSKMNLKSLTKAARSGETIRPMIAR